MRAKTPNKKKVEKIPRMFLDIHGFFFQPFIFFYREKKNPRTSHEHEWVFFSRKKKQKS